MIGIEEAYCNTLIKALLLANYALLETTVVDALQHTRDCILPLRDIP
jgi:hypothetical protein